MGIGRGNSFKSKIVGQYIWYSQGFLLILEQYVFLLFPSSDSMVKNAVLLSACLWVRWNLSWDIVKRVILHTQVMLKLKWLSTYRLRFLVVMSLDTTDFCTPSIALLWHELPCNNTCWLYSMFCDTHIIILLAGFYTDILSFTRAKQQ